MSFRPGRIKPGWYLLAALVVYSVVVTVALARANDELRDLRVATVMGEAAPPPTPLPAESAGDSPGLWYPLPGASLPAPDAHLPGAERTYRAGVSQGFDFYDAEIGIPVPYGTPVIASASGTLERVDDAYSEMSSETFAGLLAAVVDGATEEQLDLLRGRQIWLRDGDGRLMRYAHLSAVREGVAEGQTVFRGQVIGYVGNSGTDAGVAGTTRRARLHFEIWDGTSFFGEDLDSDAVRFAAASLFTGP